jgi:hypothetical protein
VYDAVKGTKTEILKVKNWNGEKGITRMLPPALKFGFEKFRRGLSSSARSDLDRLVLRLSALKVSGGDYLTCFTTALARAAPGLTSEECRALAFYGVCALLSSQSLGILAADDSVDGETLMGATQQMQEAQMSFNLQYLMLQEGVQNYTRKYTCLSNLMKGRYDVHKGALASLK